MINIKENEEKEEIRLRDMKLEAKATDPELEIITLQKTKLKDDRNWVFTYKKATIIIIQQKSGIVNIYIRFTTRDRGFTYAEFKDFLSFLTEITETRTLKEIVIKTVYVSFDEKGIKIENTDNIPTDQFQSVLSKTIKNII